MDLTRNRTPIRERGLTILVVGFCGAAAVLVAAIFTVLIVSVHNLRDDHASARRSSDLVIASATAERAVLDLETGLRGFLLTGQPSFLAPYRSARARWPGEFRTLTRLAEDTQERRQVRQIGAAVSNYVQHYAAPLAATGGQLSRGALVARTVLGKQLVDRIRRQFASLTTSEMAQQSAQQASAAAASHRATVAAGVGLVGSVLLLTALATYLVLRFIGPTRVVASAARRLTDSRLDVRVPEVGIGEMAMLARSFNAMAAGLETRETEVIRAREQLEEAVREAREASAMKSNFLANMSHEIRTPLNGVVGMIDLLSETRLSEEQREYVAVAKSSSDSLMTVVNDVLDIAKIEAGRLELEDRDFDLYDLVESACEMVAAIAVAKGIEVQSFVPDDVPRVVRGDRMRVGQILANLLSNAVKFTARGEVVLEVGLAAPSEGRVPVTFAVRDTGIGIAPERLDELFEPFTQAEAGTTRRYGGTGLGLTITKELTQMMDGAIHVESRLRYGSTFLVTIPFGPSRRKLRPAAPSRELRGLHVLIVDDNPTNRRIFEAYTASWGMRPVLADGGGAALSELAAAAARGDPFDVALLDLNMPEQSGFDLAREIDANERLRATRLILLTSSDPAIGENPDARVDRVLGKPVRQSRLLDAISAVMSGDAPRSRRPSQPVLPAIGGRSRRVLVAEDQPVNWMLVQRLLGKRGVATVNAVNGREAVEMLATTRYDLVLMDCQMPLLDGYAATREIRRRERKDGGHVPIVAMTANAMEGDRDRCLAVGMDDYLPKPITSEALDDVLGRWLPLADDGGPSELDANRMDELRTLFPEGETAEIIEQLQTEVEAQLERLNAALDDEDGAEAGEAAHRILSSARLVGADAMAEQATELQSLANHDLTAARRSAAALRERWESVSAALELERATSR
jgi:signal transduction histidine kinase/DNA-binding response OmpR family regulator/HPt (histidine-containing phosphotransfer) domain-containing protein